MKYIIFIVMTLVTIRVYTVGPCNIEDHLDKIISEDEEENHYFMMSKQDLMLRVLDDLFLPDDMITLDGMIITDDMVIIDGGTIRGELITMDELISSIEGLVKDRIIIYREQNVSEEKISFFNSRMKKKLKKYKELGNVTLVIKELGRDAKLFLTDDMTEVDELISIIERLVKDKINIYREQNVPKEKIALLNSRMKKRLKKYRDLGSEHLVIDEVLRDIKYYNSPNYIFSRVRSMNDVLTCYEIVKPNFSIGTKIKFGLSYFISGIVDVILLVPKDIPLTIYENIVD